ncbi:Cache domain-containing protein [Desulfonispora thiosulfatigenes DSM 11270]|uniref:Cache domain-containing protein n=1 Tax=Desulfonispora thiosulfatigenes DSM 11270 TaxID=656914 RepID=A0A1W1V3G7_DESTI|nr:cache domain-containing protein [Desulfonispora thiosulfatigenes]SMB87826.1 Cache domain-containing protein [Desulfonispora thiosulfatigenes DSM 11270]
MGFVDLYSNSYDQAVNLSKEVSKGYANKISGEIDVANATLNGIYNSILFAKESGTLNREQVINLLKTSLEKTPSLVAVYTLWEPNAFDGKDNDYVNKEGHDVTGRLLPYVSKSNDQTSVIPLVDYDKEGAGDYYLIPKKTKKTSLIEPYMYKVNGKDILITSLTMPIIDNNGNFIGIVGADISLDAIQGIVNNAKPMGGYAEIITGNGTIVANGANQDLVTENFISLDKSNEDIVNKIANHEEFIKTSKSSSTGDISLRVYEPILANGVDANWSFGSTIPNKNVYEQYNKLLKITLPILIIVVLIIIAVMFF